MCGSENDNRKMFNFSFKYVSVRLNTQPEPANRTFHTSDKCWVPCKVSILSVVAVVRLSCAIELTRAREKVQKYHIKIPNIFLIVTRRAASFSALTFFSSSLELSVWIFNEGQAKPPKKEKEKKSSNKKLWKKLFRLQLRLIPWHWREIRGKSFCLQSRRPSRRSQNSSDFVDL